MTSHDSRTRHRLPRASALSLGVLLAACGGGGEDAARLAQQAPDGRRVALADVATGLTDEQALRYIASYGDLVEAFGADPAKGRAHYQALAAVEGRTITFDPMRYLASHGDLIQAFGADTLAATRHYIVDGYRERRRITFDPFVYVASYADLVRAMGANADAATRHFVVDGYREGRRPGGFDAAAYLAAYGDLREAYGQDLSAAARHFILWGRQEGRTDGVLAAQVPLRPNMLDVPQAIAGVNGIACSGAASSGWCQVNRAPDTMSFLDDRLGWGLDAQARFYVTTDGGTSWTTRPSGITGVQLDQAKLAFVDASTGWLTAADAVTGQGAVLRTTDGGQSWSRLGVAYGNFGPTVRMVVSTGTRAAVVVDGTVIATHDAGQSWQRAAAPLSRYVLEAPYGEVFTGVAHQGFSTQRPNQDWPSAMDEFTQRPTVRSSGVLWAVDTGDGNAVVRSRDFGLSFERVFLPEGGVRSVSFVDERNGWAIGPQPTAGAPAVPPIWRTRDGGASWSAVAATGLPAVLDDAPPAPATVHARARAVIRFSTADVGWLDLSPPISDRASNLAYQTRQYRTTDGGLSWKRLVIPAAAGVSNGMLAILSADVAVTRPLVYPLGLVMAQIEPASATMPHVTVDGGATWKPLTLPPEVQDATRFVSLGGARIIAGAHSPALRSFRYLSEDGGLTWRAPFMPRTTGAAGLYGGAIDARVWMLRPGAWWSEASDAAAQTNAFSADAGVSWTPKDRMRVAPIAAARSRRAQVLHDDLLFRTFSDYLTCVAGFGSDFSDIRRVGTSTAIADSDFVDANTGYLVTTTHILKTRNGARSWESVAPVPIAPSGVRFIDASRGILIGAAGAVATTVDGGASWQVRTTGVAQPLTAVRWVNASVVVAVGEGGTIIRSIDAGATWARIGSAVSARLADLAFADERQGWIVGAGGTVLATSDGGATWRRQAAGTNLDLVSVHATTDGQARLFDAAGGVYGTATKGD